MYSLNQEFPVGKGHQSFLKRHSSMQEDASGRLVINSSVESQVFRVEKEMPSDWSLEWLSNRWVANNQQAAGEGNRFDASPLRAAILREEDFGAILFEPGSDRVFKLNKPGVVLFRAIRDEMVTTEQALEPGPLAGFSANQVSQFVDYLRVAGLWSR